MKMNRVMAIAEKDMKEFMRNMMLLSMPVISLFLAVVYSRIPVDGQGSDKFELAIVVVGITFCSVLTSAMMTMLAEENEKHTLRGLINSPATMFDILAGKSIVTGIITFITVIAALFILKINIFFNAQMIAGFIGLFLFFLLLGISCGLLVKSIASTSAYLVPILFIFGMGPMFSDMGFSKGNIAVKLLNSTPVAQYIKLSNNDSIMPLVLIWIWTAVMILIAAYLFKRKSVDK